MNASTLRPLLDQVEANIRQGAADDVEVALAAARDAAFRAYADALRPLCGYSFEITVSDALSAAEAALKPMACAAAEGIRTKSVLSRLATL